MLRINLLKIWTVEFNSVVQALEQYRPRILRIEATIYVKIKLLFRIFLSCRPNHRYQFGRSIALPAGGQGAIPPSEFQYFGQNHIWSSDKKMFGKNQNFLAAIGKIWAK